MPPRAKRTPAAPTVPTAEPGDARAQALKDFCKQMGAGELFTFTGERQSLKVPVVPTGALSLDLALGVGGLPRGRIVEMYGPESVGKTSLALSAAAQAIKAGGMAAMIDAEHAINAGHLKAMGVDPDYFAIHQPESGQAAFTKLDQMLQANLFDVIIVDSVAMLVPEEELKGEMDDVQVGAQARMISKGLRKVNGTIGRSKTVVIFINQLRMKVGVQFGNPEDTPGGKALKYMASVRLDIRSAAGARIKHPDNPKEFIGLGTTVTVVKNKVAPPQQKAEYRLIWGKGIDFPSSVFDAATKLDVLTPAGGNSYAIAGSGEVLTNAAGAVVRGKDNIISLLGSDPALCTRVAEVVYATIDDTRTGLPAPALVPDSDFDGSAEEAALDEGEPALAS